MRSSDDWELESGFDPAAMLLGAYDSEHQSWNFRKTGNFWESVAMAHQLERRGQGQVVAVIDDGFDLGYSELQAQDCPWGHPGGANSVHGTAVALLIRHIAPDARLLLYPVASEGQLSPTLIEKALRDVVLTDATIVNLSLGQKYALDHVYSDAEWLATVQPWQHQMPEDEPFVVLEAMKQLGSWRRFARIPDSCVGNASIDVAVSGRTLIASAGNSDLHLYDPAVRSVVYSAAFFGNMPASQIHAWQRAAYPAPDLNQSPYADFAILQPPDVLGTSFAAPLLSGLAALMTDRRDLEAYRKVLWYSGLMTAAIGELAKAPTATDEFTFGPEVYFAARRADVVEVLARSALQAIPHSHNSQESCPECSFFAVASLCNYGLYLLNSGYIERARDVLSIARQYAPHNADVAAVLGRAWAVAADVAILWLELGRTKDVPDTVRMLTRAQSLLRFALSKEPQWKRERQLLEEVESGIREPVGWHLSLEFGPNT